MGIKRREILFALGGSALLSACGGSEVSDPQPVNAFTLENLVSDSASASAFKPSVKGVLKQDEFFNAWGIAIRPAGAGGHFWVGAGAYSYQFLGDVRSSGDAKLKPLSQDQLKLVRVPGTGVPEGGGSPTDLSQFEGYTTGVVFNGAPLDSDLFRIKGQTVSRGGQSLTLEGSARFLFASDSGVISGWTERQAGSGAIVREDGPAVTMIDGRDQGKQYFGLALRSGTWDELWAADFGADPQIRAWNAQWQSIDLIARKAFLNPFIGTKPRATPGDYVPFNIQVLNWQGKDHVFVAYAKSQPDPLQPGAFLAGEEDAIAKAQEGDKPDRGRVAIFDLQGKLVKTLQDDGRLNAPWGLAIAPAGFGPFAGHLLVGNFGGKGRINVYDLSKDRWVDWLRDAAGQAVQIEGLWGLQFGNGASLGDATALYVAAGPADETQGLFGVLRPHKSS
ncbi:TIGR03118 family protein [Paucibacter sp. KBW04]|nr:TIGR03118 family protein [Paucibacter sp. KBW04]